MGFSLHNKFNVSTSTECIICFVYKIFGVLCFIGEIQIDLVNCKRVIYSEFLRHNYDIFIIISGIFITANKTALLTSIISIMYLSGKFNMEKQQTTVHQIGTVCLITICSYMYFESIIQFIIRKYYNKIDINFYCCIKHNIIKKKNYRMPLDYYTKLTNRF